MHASQKLLLPNCLLIVLAAATAAAPAFGQASDPPKRGAMYNYKDPNMYYRPAATMGGKTVMIPVGTTLEGRIDSTLSSTSSVPGQRFNIVIASPVMMNGSDVIIPSGSRIVGEVVEAVPANRVPPHLGQDKRLVHGKLRVQVSGLQTPDGVTWPMVASFTGEIEDPRHGGGVKQPLGTGVAYVGTAASFEAVQPGMASKAYYSRTDHAPQVVTKDELMRDPLLGRNRYEDQAAERNIIRSLVLKKRDYFIYESSPITVRITAPFKIGITPPGMGVPVGQVIDQPVEDTLPPPSRRMSSEQRFGGGNPMPPDAQPPQQGVPQQAPADAPRPNPAVMPADSF
jgi:hypothetical protein